MSTVELGIVQCARVHGQESQVHAIPNQILLYVCGEQVFFGALVILPNGPRFA